MQGIQPTYFSTYVVYCFSSSGFAQFVAILNVEKSRIFKENILWLGQVPRKSGTFCRSGRPAKSGASWEPSSKKIFRLKENIQPKSRTFDKNQHFCRKSRIIRLIKGEKEPKLSAVTSNYFFEGHCTQNFLWKFLETNSKILVVSYCNYICGVRFQFLRISRNLSRF